MRHVGDTRETQDEPDFEFSYTSGPVCSAESVHTLSEKKKRVRMNHYFSPCCVTGIQNL